MKRITWLGVAALGSVALSFAPAAALAASGEPPPPFAVATTSGLTFDDDAALFDATDGRADEITNEILVDVRDDASEADVAALALEYGLALHPNSPWSFAHDKFEVATSVAPEARASLVERLSRDSRVEHAEPMAVLHAYFVPNDPFYAAKQWHLQKVGAETAWEFACGEGVTVAVIDTGVACYDNGPFSVGSDLSGTRCSGGFDFVNDRAEASDDQGHGTHVAGTIAQTTNNAKGVAGLAYCARLMPVKVLNRFGWGTLADVAEGIRYAADNGAQVINLSLGGPGKSAILEDAIDHALKKDVVVVAAAGNSGRSVGYPAAYDGVIAVSATDQNDNIAWFSSRGPEVVIGAPGVAVTQQTVCEGGRNKCELFGTFNGTSMASPHVAGAAAMIVGMGVTNPASVRAALTASAEPREGRELYGAGRLDAGAAVKRVFLSHLALRAGALFALFALLGARLKRRGSELVKRPGVVFGMLLGSVGLLPFAPFVGLASHAGRLRPLVEMAMRPFGEWDLLLGSSVHEWLPLASALPTLILTSFLFGAKRVRPVLGGFALGGAALLAQLAVSADVAFPLGGIFLRVFAVVNMAVCLWVARIALDKKTA